ncbi:MAG: adenosylcobinamide-GDP ribazoletransferase, partial [Candidatus Competibacter denitrificans]
AALIAVVMIALYDGWGTPSEVAGVGAAGSLVLVISVATLVLLQWQGGVLLGILGLSFFGIRLALMHRLGGVTGDTLGAACELAETLILLTLVLVTDLELF